MDNEDLQADQEMLQRAILYSLVNKRQLILYTSDFITWLLMSCRLHEFSSNVTKGCSKMYIAASRAWNSLPAALRDTLSLLCFRRRLKTSLFQSSFDC